MASPSPTPASPLTPHLHRGIKLFRFLLSGLPTFLLAVPLNYALVEMAGLGKGLAYAAVLVCQVSVNFFLVRFFVFERKNPRSLLVEFGAFFGGIMLIRAADWAAYYVLVNVVGLYYLAVQVFNVALFALVKFLFSEKILR